MIGALQKNVARPTSCQEQTDLDFEFAKQPWPYLVVREFPWHVYFKLQMLQNVVYHFGFGAKVAGSRV